MSFAEYLPRRLPRPEIQLRVPRTLPWIALPRDPRWFQIAALGSLLFFGEWALDFPLGWWEIVLIAATMQGVQWLGTKWAGLPKFDPKSALISTFGLCFLLRANSLGVYLGFAALAIASKFLLRYNGKHLFNPTNFVLILALITGWGWVTPGQWGTPAILAFAMLCAGGCVVYRALRSDVSLVFLSTYAAIVFTRSLYMGEPLTIPLHRLENGALLIFTFFMISDPKTTPDSRTGRVLYGVCVALVAGFIQFKLFRANPLLWALILCVPLVPLLDRLLPAARHQWIPGQNLASPPQPQRQPQLRPQPAAGGQPIQGDSHVQPLSAAA